MTLPRLTVADLRPASGRWTFRRKGEVVMALDRGQISRAEVIDGLGLTDAELDSWRRRFNRHGFAGLRETRVQHYRPRPEGQGA